MMAFAELDVFVVHEVRELVFAFALTEEAVVPIDLSGSLKQLEK